MNNTEKLAMQKPSLTDRNIAALATLFPNALTEEAVTAIARKKPYYAVFRDSSYASDSVATNFEQIFAGYSPDTVRRVL